MVVYNILIFFKEPFLGTGQHFSGEGGVSFLGGGHHIYIYREREREREREKREREGEERDRERECERERIYIYWGNSGPKLRPALERCP